MSQFAVKEMYYSIVRMFFKEEYKQSAIQMIDKYYDYGIVSDNYVQTGCHSDGTLLFEYEQIAYALWDAIEQCELNNKNKFGNYILETESTESPDPNRPFLTDHVTVKIPMKCEIINTI